MMSVMTQLSVMSVTERPPMVNRQPTPTPLIQTDTTDNSANSDNRKAGRPVKVDAQLPKLDSPAHQALTAALANAVARDLFVPCAGPDGERSRGYAEADVAAVASRLHTNSVNGSNGTNGSNGRYPNSSEGSQSNRSNRSKCSDRSDESDDPADPCPNCGYSLTLRAGTQKCTWRHKLAQKGGLS